VFKLKLEISLFHILLSTSSSQCSTACKTFPTPVPRRHRHRCCCALLRLPSAYTYMYSVPRVSCLPGCSFALTADSCAYAPKPSPSAASEGHCVFNLCVCVLAAAGCWGMNGLAWGRASREQFRRDLRGSYAASAKWGICARCAS
jgi:hypothetical protein